MSEPGALAAVAGALAPAAEWGQLGALLWIAVKLGRVDALAAELRARLSAVEVWLAGRGHLIGGGNGAGGD